MDGQGGPARYPGIARIGSLAALGVAALIAFAQAFTSGSLLVGGLSAFFFGAFLMCTKASFAQPVPALTIAPRRDVPLAQAARVAEPTQVSYVAETWPGPPSEEHAPELTAEERAPEPPAEQPAEQPPAPPEAAPRPACLTVRTPATLEPEVVLMALLESAAAAGEVVAVHCWLEDPSSGTLRQIASVGSLVPETHPLPVDDDPLGLAIKDGAARLSACAAVRFSGERSTLWRYAVPLQADESHGVVGIDFSSAEAPDAGALVEITAQLRPALAGSLALHVARTETATARALVQSARELSRRIDPEEVVEHALARAMALSDAATGSVMLLDEESGQMRIAAAHGLQADVVRDTRVREGEGIAGWVLATRKPVLIEDLPGREGRGRHSEVRSAVSVPLGDEDGMLGVLNVGSREYPARFTDSHMEALTLLGTQTAVALRNARAMTSARELYFATLRALALALETKDPYARGGTERVVRFTTLLADELGLEEVERQALEVAALLHDIGMSAAGENVASSARPLSTFERGLLKLHPVLAAEILEEVPALRAVIPIVYHHHECYDGSGYVVGLAGESIPLGARILAVADAFVAMTSDRPYRAAMSTVEALDELQDKAGSQFDPEVVGAFLDLLRRQPELAPDAQR